MWENRKDSLESRTPRFGVGEVSSKEGWSYHLLRKGSLEMESIYCEEDLKLVLDMLTFEMNI